MLFRNLLTASIACALTAPLGAQSASDTAAAVVSIASAPDSLAAAGPRLALSAVAVRNRADASTAQFRTQPMSMGKPMALMIVGGAAFVLGALIGHEAGSLFMIGGTVSFLIGLYQYLR